MAADGALERHSGIAAHELRLGGRDLVVGGDIDDDAIAFAVECFPEKCQGQGPTEQFADFAEPLLEFCEGALGGGADRVHEAMSLAMLFWNLAMMDDRDVERSLEDFRRMTWSPTIENGRAFRVLALSMVARHRRMFPDLHDKQKRGRRCAGS